MAKPADMRFRLGRARALAAAVALLLLANGCQSMRSFKERARDATGKVFGVNFDDPMAEAKLRQAEEQFAGGQYEQARELFRGLADNQGNTAALAERARFMQAECRYRQGQFPEACDTYHKVLLDFPIGTYRVDCCARMFEICDYWLDDFRDELERRSNEKGIMRWKPSWPDWRDRTKPRIDQEGRTIEALERIHTNDPKGPMADKAIFWCGYINFIRGNFTESDHFFSQMVEMHPDSPLRPQAIALAIQSKNSSTGGAPYDGRKCAEALQLVHVAEATVPELTNNPEMSEKLTRAKFAIRSQQAEKDYLTAEYYERTGHPGSAVFYYELVRRRYSGTRYADIATDRQARLIKMMQEGHPEVGNDPLAVAKAKWKQVFGKQQSLEEQDRVRSDPNLVVPTGGIMPQQGISGTGSPRP